MAKVTVTLPKFLSRGPRDIGDAARQGVEIALENTRTHVLSLPAKADPGTAQLPRDRGILANGIQPTAVSVTSSVVKGALKITGVAAAHGSVMELGRKPASRMPPQKPVLDWVRRNMPEAVEALAQQMRSTNPKLKLGRKGGRVTSGSTAREKALLRLTWLIRRKIGRQGQYARSFFSGSLEFALAEAKAQVEAALRRKFA